MYDVDDILFEYERLLDGKRKSLNISCVYGEKMREEAFGTILRYVLRDKILKWTAAEAIELFNDQIAKEYKIDKAYGLINYDPRLYYPKSYLLRYAYPEEIEYDFLLESSIIRNAYYVDFFDSVGIYITSDYFELNKGFYSEILNENFEIVKPTRQEALAEAIKKANEIYNEKYSISQ